jgi:hypothetical protein
MGFWLALQKVNLKCRKILNQEILNWDSTVCGLSELDQHAATDNTVVNWCVDVRILFHISWDSLYFVIAVRISFIE